MYGKLNLLALIAIATASPMSRPALNPLFPTGQIIGGTEARIEEVPHQVSLQTFGFGFCYP
ncbi:uncharacterized protein LOC116185884 [Apis dorsata]|uniref:uncharacterized protein LOC116185884 n=1 Tax=Apis dorsata TaxID=7462 RepID=UPI001293D619|nr:uncharacterized protein LOC116185884 [Apis dorsata]